MKKKKIVITSASFIIPAIIVSLIVIYIAFNFQSSLDYFSNLFNFGRLTNEKLLESSKSWMINLDFSSEDDIDKIKESNFDTIVVDISDVDRDSIEEIKEDNNKLVLCYLNIGQAESFRDYWKSEWDSDKPNWIKEEDEEWEGEFNIDFTNEEWKNILYKYDNSYLNTIFLNEYDGVYFDLTGIDYWVGRDEGKEEGMIELIEELADFIEQRDSHFLIVAQNVAFLNGNYSERLKDVIDGVAQEELYYGYENRDGKETPVSVTRSIEAKLDKYKKARKPVFILDYPFICRSEDSEVSDTSCYDIENIERMRNSYSSAENKGYIAYNQNREITGLTYSLPLIRESNVRYDNLPILSWETYSGNSEEAQSAYRLFISSTEEKCRQDEADIYDSGKVWSGGKVYDLIIDKPVETGEYYWKVAVYEQADDISLVSPWSDTNSIKYEAPDIDLEGIKPTEEYQTAWIPNWAFDTGFESLKKNKSKFDSISPVWFKVSEEGDLNQDTRHNDQEFMDFCRDNDIELIPSIPIFDPDIVSKVLNERLDQHVNEIVYEVKEGGYDGIDIDYEATYSDDSDLFLEFIKQLSIKLHSNDRVLSLTVLSKWTDEEIYGWLPETRKVQDWRKLDKYIDELRIMAYDYSSQNSYIPGPMSPIYWDDMILSYATDKVSSEKIVLALPIYGYSFRIDERSDIGSSIFEGGEKFGSERRVLAYTYEEIIGIGDEFEFDYSYNDFYGELVINYNDGVYDRELYILDDEAIRARKKLAEKYGIKGISYWRLGGDDSRNY